MGEAEGTNTNKEVAMKIGDKVLVPRTGGGTSKGEIIELYTTVEAARVKFPLDGTYQGGPIPEGVKASYGYKTIRLSDLKPIRR